MTTPESTSSSSPPRTRCPTRSARRSWPTPASAATSPTTWSPSSGPRAAAGTTPSSSVRAAATRPGDHDAALRAGDLRGAEGVPPARRLGRHLPARGQRPALPARPRGGWRCPSCRSRPSSRRVTLLVRQDMAWVPGTRRGVALPAPVHDRDRGRARRAPVQRVPLPGHRLARRRVLPRRRQARLRLALRGVRARRRPAARATPRARRQLRRFAGRPGRGRRSRAATRSSGSTRSSTAGSRRWAA